MSWRKGSTVSNDTSAGSNGSRGGPVIKQYPFALALRIRVVQIVFGICEVVMGSVAMIEERSTTNLGMSFAAGSITVMAASWSVRRRFYRDDSRRSFIVMVWSRLLWFLSYSLQLHLLYIAVVMMVDRYHYGIEQCNNTRLGLAIVMCVLGVGSILACLASFRNRLIYGSAPAMPPPDRTNCQRSTSHTAVSMVPMICNPPISLECRLKNDNTSSENEMEEIILPEGNLSPTKGEVPYRDTTAEEETLAISNSRDGCAIKTNDVTLKKTNSATPNKTYNVTPNNTNDTTPNRTNDAIPNITNDDAISNITNDVTPNQTNFSGGADPVVDAPSSDRVPNSVEFNLNDNATHKSNNCNGHSKSTKITM